MEVYCGDFLARGSDMANQLYKDHFLIWAANYTSYGDWIPEVTISWTTHGRFNCHRLTGPLQVTEEAAMAVAKQLGERWVDREL
jgi:hypothetical protein